jgi:hemerythrin superfamily protein
MAKTTHGAMNAVELLRADHEKVKQLFKEFVSTKDKAVVAKQIFNELEMHATLEEELFYPAIRVSVGPGDVSATAERETADDIIAIAEAEHKTVKDHIKMLKQLGPDAEQFRERFAELQDAVIDHLTEEEEVLFPAAMLRLDVADLGAKMDERRIGLAAEKAGR